MLTGWIAGGLAQVAIVLSALMGGVSGSAVAEAAMEARILGPAMLKPGYTKGYTCATIAVGALITATIPPSIGLILYGFMGNVSIGQLFVGGIIPGLLMTVFLMFTAWLIARKRGYKPDADRLPTAREVLCDIWDCKWALLFPVFLILGIRYGIFTPSEAGAFAVAYAIFIGFFVYRELTWTKLIELLRQSIDDNGMIMLIIMFSAMIGYMITLEGVPQAATNFLVVDQQQSAGADAAAGRLHHRARHVPRKHRDRAAADADPRAGHHQGRHRPCAFRAGDDDDRDARRHDAAGRRRDVHGLRDAQLLDGRVHARGDPADRDRDRAGRNPDLLPVARAGAAAAHFLARDPLVPARHRTVPGGEGELRLMRRGAEFSIRLDRYELMNSRLSGSEEALAAIACDRIKSRRRRGS